MIPEQCTYDELVKMKEDLEKLLIFGEDYQDIRNWLKAVNDELGRRIFALVFRLGGNVVRIWNRYRTENEAINEAKRIGLPTGTPIDLADRKFQTEVCKIK